jgi:hypothetical protein
MHAVDQVEETSTRKVDRAQRDPQSKSGGRDSVENSVRGSGKGRTIALDSINIVKGFVLVLLRDIHLAARVRSNIL